VSRAVDSVTAALRERILDGDLRPGERLVEAQLTERHGAARHTVRAALRALASEGLVRVEPNRGARVAAIDEPTLRGLYDLRTALELEGARRALERHDGRLPEPVHAALGALRAAQAWSAVAEAHLALHHAIVAAAGSPRLTAEHAALQGEERLFLAALRALWTRERMAGVHGKLLRDLERRGPEPLRAHLDEGLAAVLGALRGGR
jgi:DNA-binding GntR family transcriptional regulator